MNLQCMLEFLDVTIIAVVCLRHQQAPRSVPAAALLRNNVHFRVFFFAGGVQAVSVLY